MADPVVIAAAARTPLGAFQGSLSGLTATALGAAALRGAIARSRIEPACVDEALLGCVLTAGLGQAPARQSALMAGLPEATGCTTVNKVCGSGLKAIMLGHDALLAGSAAVVAAGGMESMSQAPYLLARARSGYRLGHGQLVDHLFLDGLEEACGATDRGRLMGALAEDCAARLGIGRAEQDAYARLSGERARQASAAGAFAWEIEPVGVPGPGGGGLVATDEGPQRFDPARITGLKPAFSAGGTITAGNASSLADGAAAVVLLRASRAEALGIAPLARIVAHASHAQAPADYPTAPGRAVEKLLARCGWKAGDVDLFEINEAFAVVTLAALGQLDLPLEKVNIHGGACALGHPIGATGARIVVTLLGALRRTGGKRGVAALCIGGGEAVALAVEVC
ncbi:MAG: acetyl-CoA C-acyltransferase [Azonexus sp.]|nr:acetyl-CoA C-acyltransferase [Betaproteobacteria bacterium]MBK8919550.1 acetyl-CoA C-acyltransferase [Betaproteobacteria bacterium]MBP6036318.1 acetyl-CoA C-acyltransferase [Azonexus sp.]MBP6906818.1 acetyl-CoA C-acyltransferase [Azonexus sp.]